MGEWCQGWVGILIRSTGRVAGVSVWVLSLIAHISLNAYRHRHPGSGENTMEEQVERTYTLEDG